MINNSINKRAFRELFKFSLTNQITEPSVFSTLSYAELIKLLNELTVKKTNHLFYPYLSKLKLNVPEDLIKYLHTKYNQRLMYYLSQEKGIELISSLLEKHNIRFLIMKGGETRNLFKDVTFRVSNDVDILVDNENCEKVIDILTKEAKGEPDLDGEVHYAINILNKGAHIEVHRNLFSSISAPKLSKVFNDPFSNTFLDEKYKTRYHLNWNYMYAYLVAHMSKHVKTGEAWLPPLMDIYKVGELIKNDRKQADKLLKEAELDKFEAILRSLILKYLKDEELNQEESLLESFILRDEGDNQVLVNKVKYKNKFSYVFHRLWLPKNMLGVMYPNVNKCSVLVPFYQVKRWFRALKEGKLSSSVNKLDKFGKANQNEINEVNNLFNEIGLQEGD